MPDWTKIEERIQAVQGHSFRVKQQQPIGGGCINQAWLLSDGPMQYFVKLNQPQREYVLAAEFAGLKEIIASRSIRAPDPVACGKTAQYAYLITEYLDLHGRMEAASLARDLATMHHCTHEQFGWYRNNTIGATEQINTQTDQWPEFFSTHRLGVQLRLAEKNTAPSTCLDRGWAVCAALPHLFSTYQPRAALLHGDLWSGNYAALADGTAVIYDPAVYYGDHEADLAMMELFGHPGADFFAAYNEHFSIDEDYPLRRTLYNSYHIMNHYNLFGGSYAVQAEQMLAKVLSNIT